MKYFLLFFLLFIIPQVAFAQDTTIPVTTTNASVTTNTTATTGSKFRAPLKQQHEENQKTRIENREDRQASKAAFIENKMDTIFLLN